MEAGLRCPVGDAPNCTRSNSAPSGLAAGPIGHVAGAFVKVESCEGHAPDQVIVVVDDCRSGSSLVVPAAAPTLDQTRRFSQVVGRSTVPRGGSGDPDGPRRRLWRLRAARVVAADRDRRRSLAVGAGDASTANGRIRQQRHDNCLNRDRQQSARPARRLSDSATPGRAQSDPSAERLATTTHDVTHQT
jgi:hypothetical protein